jgi:hypothetical protein
MPALMRTPRRPAPLLLLLLLGMGCGKEIGDPCVAASDCSPNGDRQCDRLSTGGYCTIQGCDYDTCPEEAACIRFFTGSFSNLPCDPDAEDRLPGVDACSPDELCSLVGNCVPRSSEVRFCMKTCDSDGDCRDGYECRDLAKMKEHGGQPVLAPGSAIDESSPKFCATAP